MLFRSGYTAGRGAGPDTAYTGVHEGQLGWVGSRKPRGGIRQSEVRIPPFIFTDGSEECLEGGLSPAVKPPHGKEGSQRTDSLVFGMAGGTRIRRYGR